MGMLKTLSDVFKSMKRRSPSLKLCPRCGSPKLRLSSRFDGWLTPEQYICENCGYKGPVVMELEEKKENTNQAP
ncbi:MAG: hypothetical protein OEX76_06260 [Candidatus Bathyarchaeota archaeon]|nr:hypothetical protein [Candidatus Bathyarchaeota archaeon]MDH5713306.1 hypothetical protein [Candidatus Bathyarchaeota archaeon]